MSDVKTIPSGLEGKASLTVTKDDLAIALKSGDVPVLGTPRVVALCEEATVNAMALNLAPNQTTVGTLVELKHFSPTALGKAVTARATLVSSEGALVFDVIAMEGDKVIAKGKVRRAIVDRQKFLESLA